MSLMDFTPDKSTKKSTSGTMSWYIYLEVFLRGNFDDVVTINSVVKNLEPVSITLFTYHSHYIVLLCIFSKRYKKRKASPPS